MSEVPKIMYHVTLNRNVSSIKDRGIDPSFSKGKLIVSWFVDFEHIQWALVKMSLKHKVPVSDMVIFEINEISNTEERSKFVKWPLKNGLYTCKDNVKAYVYYRTDFQTLEELGVM